MYFNSKYIIALCLSKAFLKFFSSVLSFLSLQAMDKDMMKDSYHWMLGNVVGILMDL